MKYDHDRQEKYENISENTVQGIHKVQLACSVREGRDLCCTEKLTS